MLPTECLTYHLNLLHTPFIPPQHMMPPNKHLKALIKSNFYKRKPKGYLDHCALSPTATLSKISPSPHWRLSYYIVKSLGKRSFIPHFILHSIYSSVPSFTMSQ